MAVAVVVLMALGVGPCAGVQAQAWGSKWKWGTEAKRGY